MESKNDEGFVVNSERLEFFITKLEENASKNFSQSDDINRVKKEALDSVSMDENGFWETKIEIEEHHLIVPQLFDKETFYYNEDNNVKKDLDTSKNVTIAKEFEVFLNGELKQSIKKDCALTASSDCGGDNSECIDLIPAVESNINSRNVYENDVLSEGFLINAVNESNSTEIFDKEKSNQCKRKIEQQLKRSVLLNNNEISNFNGKGVAEKCTLKKKSAELLGTTEDLYVHLHQQDLYELQKTFRRNQSHNNEPEKSSRPKIFRCCVCLFKSPNKFQLVVHIIEKHKEVAKAKNMMETQYMMPGSTPNEILFKCNKCSFVSAQRHLLRSHLLRHKSVDECEQIFRCASCPYVAKHKGHIVSHMLVHIPVERQRPHKCPYCDFRTKHKTYIRRHIDKMHNPEKKSPDRVVIYTCNRCSFSTKYKDSMIRHRTLHLGVSKEDMVPCTLCPYKGKSNRLLKRHMLIHKTPDEVVMHKCDLCPYSTKRKANLTQHRTIHVISEEDMIPCRLCPYKAKNKKGFSRHMQTHLEPLQITMYKCDQCSRQFRRRSHLNNHAITHMNKDERPTFQCDHCEYKTTMKHYLQTHRKLMHTDPSKINWKRCDKCEFKTKLSGSLKQHSLIHKKPEELEMFQCAHCPYSAKRKEKLKAHIERRHMNVCYNCPMCNFKTKKHSTLIRHKRKVHHRKSQA